MYYHLSLGHFSVAILILFTKAMALVLVLHPHTVHALPLKWSHAAQTANMLATSWLLRTGIPAIVHVAIALVYLIARSIMFGGLCSAR